MKRKIYTLFIILLAIFCISPATAYANSAEPPALIVIVKNAPEDISISIISEDSVKEGKKSDTVWETYYAFYKRDLGNNSQVILRVSGNGMVYDQAVGEQYLNGYNSIVTLDFSKQSIQAGKLLSRSILLVALRVLLTLAIEGLIFLLFGFRDKKSWITFLLMNLLTQGILNIALNGFSPFASYLILNLIFMEIWVFLAEITGALILIKEHGRLRRVLCVLIANIASLVLGGYLITVLPI
ncbi:hypothetical protein DFR58_102251 [Anaerobacterium chartisolvens]|uniref:Uncharacterized protein n=1 Tax=Anaerobacterium chartisolvens TaxID=1297424 RepID=A0A369BHY7_9FIRM|nr:hypothetical protein [Anaerobacterium chartisolvens]RCX20178.1 hypothetical protein DFR58_102251 [Anaerobacterium chartisolvens]